MSATRVLARHLVLLLVALLLVAVLAGRGGEPSPALAQNAGTESYGEIGTRPDYSARVAGQDRVESLKDHRGRAVMLNVWATWCVPCKEEIPDLQSISEKHRGAGLDVIGVSVDEGDYDGDVLDFAEAYGVTFGIWRDPDDDFSRTFHSVGIPETLLLDRNGVVVHRWKGPVQTGPETDRLISTALASEGGYGQAAGNGSAGVANGGSGGGSVTLLIAFLAGLMSFLSPCVLPLIPGYVALITGMSGREIPNPEDKTAGPPLHRTLASGLLFVAGFSAVFLALGASATAVGALLNEYALWISRIGGAVMLILGLHLLGIFRIPVLEREARFIGKLSTGRRFGHAGTFVVGAAFGAGWTPCIGPVLAGILTLAATAGSVSQGMGLLAAYSAGLAVPFLLATVAFGRFLTTSRRLRAIMPWIDRASGTLLILLAILLLTGSMTALSGWLSGLGVPEWTP